MSTQYNPPYAGPPPTSPPPVQAQRPFDPVKSHIMEADRSQREQSVLSGMSIEDMEAAETLNSLHRVQSPKRTQVPPMRVQMSTAYADEQPEPLLSLVTSQYPLAGAVINGSLSAYRTTQAYIPGAQWTERNLGLPLAGTVARISGVEGGLRWALQPKRDARHSHKSPHTPDMEKGQDEAMMPVARARGGSDVSFPESLPAYNATDRSPPYEQQQLLTQDRRPPPGWRQQLVISTSGLGIAMSDESLRSLRYCLKWLKWANRRLGAAIQSLRDLVEQWSDEDSRRAQNSDGTSPLVTQSEAEGREAALAARISAVRAEVLQTLKQVVNVVSTYAGGALPENARNLVHRHLISLPQRFNIASAMSTTDSTTNAGGEPGNDAANSANKVMVLAQEGLDMMTQVSRVVNDTLISAEAWCERLGRRKRSNTANTNADPDVEPSLPLHEEKPAEVSFAAAQQDMTVDQRRDADGDGDIQMTM